jgi:hypothetical protein
MYGVFENGKPCSEVGFPDLKGHGWTTSEFKTLAEAVDYAKKWLGDFGDEDFALPLGTLEFKYCYNGYDSIVIKKLDVEPDYYTCEGCFTKYTLDELQKYNYCCYCGMSFPKN